VTDPFTRDLKTASADRCAVAFESEPSADRCAVAFESEPSADRCAVAFESEPSADRCAVAFVSESSAVRRVDLAASTESGMLEYEVAMTFIDQMDFSWIIFKLTRPDPHIARVWTEEAAKAAVQQYKNYLKLARKHMGSDYTISPSVEVDEIWHQHILDTRRYHSDCQQIFGTYMHHFPYFGMRGEEDELNLQKAFAQTMSLYREEFGESLYVV
jgi:hypothetical protein